MTPPDNRTLARALTEAGAFRDAPFTVVDVGCSGGIFPPAEEFSPGLRAVGFDAIVEEVAQLKASAPPGIEYECALVEDPDWERPALRKSPGVMNRSSAGLYEHLHGFDYNQEAFNRGRPITLTHHRVRLDEWLAARADWTVDLLKVDTDGNDLGVLRSLGERLGEPLAIHIEVNFDGDVGPDSNAFSTIFDTLVAAGFRLFSLAPTRYAKATLPLPFEWNMPAQTIRGQVMQGDALFCRDLAVEGGDSPERLLKLACIFDLLDLQDCAAELLDSHADVLATSSPVQLSALMDLLGHRTELGLTPAAARQALADDPTMFFPAPATSDASVPTELPPATSAPTLSMDGGPISVGTQGPPTLLRDGWWPPEPDGAWTSSPSATIEVVLADEIPPGAIVELDAWRLSPPEGEARTVLVVNGTCLEPVDAGKVVSFATPTSLPPGPTQLVIASWPMVCPADIGDSDDERLLGLFVSSLAIRRGPGARPND